MKWDAARFEETPNALASDEQGVAVTMIVKEDHVVLAFAINVWYANLPIAEKLAQEIAGLIRDRMDRHFEYIGDHDGPDAGEREP